MATACSLHSFNSLLCVAVEAVLLLGMLHDRWRPEGFPQQPFIPDIS